jgi:hypothetical protein
LTRAAGQRSILINPAENLTRERKELVMATPQPIGREMTNREFFIRRWEQEHHAFLQVLKAAPADRLDYRPDPRARSAGERLALLVGIEQAGNELCEKGEIRWEDPGGIGTRDEMVAAYERSHEALRKQLQQMDETAWNKRSQCWEHGHVESRVNALPCYHSTAVLYSLFAKV